MDNLRRVLMGHSRQLSVAIVTPQIWWNSQGPILFPWLEVIGLRHSWNFHTTTTSQAQTFWPWKRVTLESSFDTRRAHTKVISSYSTRLSNFRFLLLYIYILPPEKDFIPNYHRSSWTYVFSSSQANAERIIYFLLVSWTKIRIYISAEGTVATILEINPPEKYSTIIFASFWQHDKRHWPDFSTQSLSDFAEHQKQRLHAVGPDRISKKSSFPYEGVLHSGTITITRMFRCRSSNAQ